MVDLEIPLGKKRTKAYRFFEMVPALVSYGTLILLVVLSFTSPLLAAIYILILITATLAKAVGIALHTVKGRQRLMEAQSIDWKDRLQQLEDPVSNYESREAAPMKKYSTIVHRQNLERLAAHPDRFPKPSSIYNAVIIATYNESYEVLQPTVQSLADTTYDNSHMIVVIAYEARGGDATKETVQKLAKEYEGVFKAFHLVEHPADLPDEVIGKGSNITYAGFFLKDWLKNQGISYSDVIITTLDSDNRPDPTYFDYVTYEYIVHEDRKYYSYQPIALFLNNIWDAPAPMRVIATGNSFWNIISSMRPHVLRNFASHSQPMDALVEMDFWSKRTIVEDGHQYWRSYFHFDGNYAVMPIHVPIYQDAVLSDTYLRTLKAQFVQLRRWAYGASDVPYVATHVFTRKRTVPFWAGFTRFLRLMDSHVTWSTLAVVVAFGSWVPLLINQEAARNIAAHQLPVIVSNIQRLAMIGLLITIFLSLKMLPPRPERYKRRHSVFMVLQWILMPVTTVVYSSFAAFNSQTRLLLGKYLDKFDVTEKATHQSVARARQARTKDGHAVELKQ
jgi:cellulose synthase/poly-beta-1,6-N-acetylglucosamine synthase-like glycosyltransferase